MWKAPKVWPTPETLITTRQLAELLGAQPETVRKWKQAGTGPPPAPNSTGKQTWYRCSDVRKWVAGNIRPVSSAFRAIDETDPRDDRGRELLSQSRSAARRSDHQTVAKLKRKITARARFFAGVGTTPGDFEEDLVANRQGAGQVHDVLDAEFEEASGPVQRQQLVRVSQPIVQLHKPRPSKPNPPAGIPNSPERDRQLLEEFLATSKNERPAF
jgi:hypothetical protein